MGYIPRQNNEVIANLMDAGKSLFGIVVTNKYNPEYRELHGGHVQWDVLKIDIFMED